MKSYFRSWFSWSLAMAMIFGASALNAAPDKAEKKEKNKGSDRPDKLVVDKPGPSPGGPAITISIEERRVIERELEVYKKGSKGKSLPPGLQKKVDRGGRLPPGWEKKLNRGEILPIEVYREAQPLPRDIVIKLPPPPAGTVLVTIHGKILRVLEKTREVVDVFDILP